jgi:hypothetical protein
MAGRGGVPPVVLLVATSVPRLPRDVWTQHVLWRLDSNDRRAMGMPPKRFSTKCLAEFEATVGATLRCSSATRMVLAGKATSGTLELHTLQSRKVSFECEHMYEATTDRRVFAHAVVIVDDVAAEINSIRVAYYAQDPVTGVWQPCEQWTDSFDDWRDEYDEFDEDDE